MYTTQCKHAARTQSRLLPCQTGRFSRVRTTASQAAERVASVNSSNKGAIKKDMVGQVMETAFTMALATRLSNYKTINVDVSCNGWSIMEGRFGGMRVKGDSWKTPLALTARTVEVSVGEIKVDYQALVLQQRLKLANVPVGSCLIRLERPDLANFVVHPLMLSACSTAVQGKPFTFDRNTVGIELLPGNKRGRVTFEGVWAEDGKRYRVIMETGVKQSNAVPAENPLQIRAEPLSATESDDEANLIGARIVGAELQKFFTYITLNLQGIELKTPTYVLTPGAGQSGVTLDISLKLRMASLPPLNMKF